MQNMKSKILSILLVLVMAIGIFPLSAFAEDVANKQIRGTGTQAENKYLKYMAETHPKEHEMRFNRMFLTNYWLQLDGSEENYAVF